MDYIATPKETARLFRADTSQDEKSISERTLRRMCIKGELFAQRVGNRWYINVTRSFPGLAINSPLDELAAG